MQYSIDWLEKKQTSKGEIIKATLKDVSGKIENDVTIWSSYPGYSELRPGSILQGSISIKVNGRYTNKSFYEDKTPGQPAGSFQRAPSGAVKAAEITRTSVQEAQKRKELSIAYFNATNSALSLLAAIGMANLDMPTDKFIVYWRDWFLAEFQKWESLDVQDKTKPF